MLTSNVHTGLIFMVFLVLIIVGTCTLSCWWMRKAIQWVLLKGHQVQHRAEQATCAHYTWLREAADNLLQSASRTPPLVPWNRKSPKRELNSTL
jgi:hypothetical protein